MSERTRLDVIGGTTGKATVATAIPQQPFHYDLHVSDAEARLSAEVASLKSALAHWRQKADEDAGRLKRYSDALYDVAFGFASLLEVRERARRELSDIAMVGHPEGPAA